MDVVGTRFEKENAHEEVERAVVAEKGPHDLGHGVGIACERHGLELHSEREEHLVVSGNEGPLDLAMEIGHDGEDLLQPRLHDQIVEIPLHGDSRLPLVRHYSSVQTRGIPMKKSVSFVDSPFSSLYFRTACSTGRQSSSFCSRSLSPASIPHFHPQKSHAPLKSDGSCTYGTPS